MASKGALTTGDVAELCHVSNVTVFRWIKRGILSAYSTPGGHYRIGKPEFLAFLEAQNMPVPDTMKESTSTSVLIVDDDRDVTLLIQRALKHGNGTFAIDSASTGYEACVKIGGKKPDLIILDLIMPGVDGFEVMKVVRQNPETRDCRILVLSGYLSEDNVERAKEYGADMFLSKPVDIQHLLDTIDQLLN